MELLPQATTKKVNKSLLVEQIYDALFDLLVKDKLAPGTKLNIDGVSKQLGVSRSPVASAFSALERDGFLRIVPQNGTFVRALTYEELNAIYLARAALERVVATFAIGKAEDGQIRAYRERFVAFQNIDPLAENDLHKLYELDLELHTFLSGFVPEIIRHEYRNICNLTRRSRMLNLKHELKHVAWTKMRDNTVTFHIEILDALIERDLEKSVRLLEKDVFYTKDTALSYLY